MQNSSGATGRWSDRCRAAGWWKSRLRTLESCAWRRWWGVELTSVPRSAGPRASRKKKDRSTRDYATSPLFFRTRRSWFWNMPKLRAKFTDSQLVELTDRLAWENYRARYDDAFGIEAEGFTKGSDCAMPVGGARKSRASTPEGV